MRLTSFESTLGRNKNYCIGIGAIANFNFFSEKSDLLPKIGAIANFGILLDLDQ